MSEELNDDVSMMRVTIVTARYGGHYEPGAWVAFAGVPRELPDEWDADDVTVENFFRERRNEVGGGSSPQEAYEDLVRRLANRRQELDGA